MNLWQVFGFVLHGLVEKVGDIMRVGSQPKSSDFL